MPHKYSRSRGPGENDASSDHESDTDEFGSRRGSNGRTTQKRAEHHFGHEFESAGEIRTVMRLEARFGQRPSVEPNSHSTVISSRPIAATQSRQQGWLGTS